MSRDNATTATTAALPQLPRASVAVGQYSGGAGTAAYPGNPGYPAYPGNPDYPAYPDYPGNPQPPPYSAGAAGGHGGPGPPPNWQGDALQSKGDGAGAYETIDVQPPAAMPGTAYQEQRHGGSVPPAYYGQQPGGGMQTGGGMPPNAYNQRPGMEPQQFGQPFPVLMTPAYPYALGVHPQVMVAPPTQPSKPYLTRSILATVFCCFLLGIFAIVGAIETRSANERGDFLTARSSSRRTKILLIVSLCSGILLYLSVGTYLIVFFVFYSQI
ncbi:uncharacterized protein LOC142905823 [Petromyzon marinus]|uniref:uncharacterized protein LOC142905823 n=1 Tax=Petromyzon marinus TaxID=7757 RepID=UPI003F6FC4FB